MDAEIISVGSELLSGRIRDLNAPLVALKLTELGFDIVKQTIVGDNSQDLKLLLHAASHRGGLIIITGGLGPTTDDITRETISEFCNVKLVTDKNSVKRIENLIKKAHTQQYTNSVKQAMVPKGSTIIHNSTGTAQGFVVNVSAQFKIFCLPGVPREVGLMFDEWVIPYIIGEVRETKKRFSKVINTFGISESTLDEKVKEIINPDGHLSYSTLVNDGVVSIHITIRDLDYINANSILFETQERICKELGTSVFSKSNKTLEEIISNLLKKNNLKLVTAESCTGGLISNLLTNVPGSSEFFLGGFVSYSDKVKKETLNVSEKLIEKYGVISEQVAKAMASGSRKPIPANSALAITGNARPTSLG